MGMVLLKPWVSQNISSNFTSLAVLFFFLQLPVYASHSLKVLQQSQVFAWLRKSWSTDLFVFLCLLMTCEQNVSILHLQCKTSVKMSLYCKEKCLSHLKNLAFSIHYPLISECKMLQCTSSGSVETFLILEQ